MGASQVKEQLGKRGWREESSRQVLELVLGRLWALEEGRAVGDWSGDVETARSWT